MHTTRISTLTVFTLALLTVWPTPVRNQCRNSKESVVRVRKVTPRLPISEVGDFRVQGYETQPLVILAARVRAGVNLTVQNVASQGISFFEYGVSGCPDASRNVSIVVDNGTTHILKAHRKATYTAATDDLEALIKTATRSSCKPLVTIGYVEFKDGTCWWPYREAEL